MVQQATQWNGCDLCWSPENEIRQQTTYLRWDMEEEFEEFEEHPQDVMEQYQDYPYDYDYW